MLTWRLWRALLDPAYHPIFRYAKQTQPRNFSLPEWLRPLVVLPLLVLCVLTLPLSIAFVLFVLIASPIAFLMLNGSIFGLKIAILTSGIIVKTRLREQYALFGATPPGRLGAEWLLCAGCAHRNDLLRQTHTMLRVLLLLVLIVVVGVTGILILTASINRDYSQVIEQVWSTLSTILMLAGFATVAYVDHVQSILVGGLLGIFISGMTRNNFDARFWPALIYVALQAFVYLTVYALWMNVLPDLFTTLRLTGPLSDVGQFACCLVIFYSLRELMIRALWKQIVQRTGADYQTLPA